MLKRISFTIIIVSKKDSRTKKIEILKDIKKHCGQQGESREKPRLQAVMLSVLMGVSAEGKPTLTFWFFPEAGCTAPQPWLQRQVRHQTLHSLNDSDEMLGKNAPHMVK